VLQVITFGIAGPFICMGVLAFDQNNTHQAVALGLLLSITSRILVDNSNNDLDQHIMDEQWRGLVKSIHSWVIVYTTGIGHAAGFLWALGQYESHQRTPSM
jgi:hypothetical protein